MPGLPRGPKSRVQRLEIENFKSYRGRQEVGPFYAFTAVIGPNGSGKSNIMDAVSFVLGVKGAQLRGSLKELLYSYTADEELIRPESGSVKLVLETEGQEDTSFQRSIVQSRGQDTYSSQYAINDRTVSWAAYEEKLKTFGILVKARNFLVFQGDIEAVASKQPLELTKLFESISGSDAFKANYEKYSTEHKAAQERLAYVQSKKKNTAAEKRQKKEQKAEAERHVKLQQQLEATKSSYYLWQLYHSQVEATAAEHELEGQQEELRETAKLLKEREAAVKEKKKEIAGLNKSRTLMEQKAKKRRTEADKNNPESVKIKAEMERTLSRIKVQEKELAEEQEKAHNSQDKIQRLQEECAKLAEEQRELEAAPSTMQTKLSSEVMAEYPAVKEEARAKTSKARNDITAQQDLQDTDQRALRDAEANLELIEQQLQKLQAASQAQVQSHAEQERDLQAARAELQEKENRLARYGLESRQKEKQRKDLEEKLRDIEEKLHESKANSKQTEKEARTRELIEEMKGIYTDLGKVTQQSYTLALAVTMAREMESVVVDSEAVAKECVAYLKQRRKPPLTFIPLRTVKAFPPHERLRALGGTSKLAIDLVEFDPKLERAFNLACGSTLVCDSEREAKELAFGARGERHKVVTKGGLLIAKGGAMTGGGDGELGAKAAQFNQGQYHQLKQERAACEKELEGFPDDVSRRSTQVRLHSDANALRARIQSLEAEVSRWEGGSRTPQQTAPLLQQKETHEAKIARIRKEMDGRQKRIDNIEERINTIEDAIYAELNEKAGVNLRIYFKENDQELSRFSAERSRIVKALIRAKTHLEYEINLDRTQTLSNLETALAKSREKLTELQKASKNLQRATAALQATAKSEADELKALKLRIDESEAVLREARSEETQQLAAGKKVHQETKRLEAALEAIAIKQSEILKTAQMEQVELPKHSGEEVEPMETDDVAFDAARVVSSLDFGRLSRQQKAAMDDAQRDALDNEFTASIEEQQGALVKVLPNLKAVDQYQEAKEKDDKEKAELEEARQNNRETANAFHDVRQQRADAYMKAFDHIKDVINPIYKDLTKSSSHPMGGTAYLSMVNSEEQPFLSGVSFTAMPPSKRWRQMEALSGGEKTVAALALLFAIHSFHPSPFFVLDEVDAALDASNVAKVANYIREKTRTEDGLEQFQAIVISLKDYFFSKADAIVGVTKHPSHGCSQTFTLDLNQFGAPEQ